MGKGRSLAPSSTSGNGGIMGSGIFGMFGSVVNCKAEDSSLYCQFVKAFNVMMMSLIIIVILYSIYGFAKVWFNERNVGKRGR
jgi:hypothetical protein